MFQAQLLATNGVDPVEIFSPWFPKNGDKARFSVEIVATTGSPFSVDIFTKDSETVGGGSSAGTLLSAGTATGITTSEVSSLKELVRYQFTVQDAQGWVLFRTLSPVWYDSVKA